MKVTAVMVLHCYCIL